jgi:uncharacterized protein (TIGR03435 family)
MLLAVAVWGQRLGLGQVDHRPAFEVASVRRHEGDLPLGGGKLTISGNRLIVRGYSLLGLLMFSYNAKIFQIAGSGSLDHTMYDIMANAPDGPTPTRDDFRLMMQSLLADRFKLKIRQEAQEKPVYALVVDRHGPKLKEAAPGAQDLNVITYQPHGRGLTRTVRNGTMDNLADRITNSDGLDRIVINMTGLTGTYDYELSYTPEYRRGRGTDPDPDEITVFQALEDQLGLKLEPRKAPVEMLVVEHVEKPRE